MNVQGNGPIGHMVELKVSDPLHYAGRAKNEHQADDVAASFNDVLMKAFDKVNNLQVDSENLTQKMIYAPESVDIHQVMIAGQKAEIALTFTKSIRDEAIRAYRELINLR